MTNAFQGIVFDFDGTLIDSLNDATASFNYAIAQLGEPPRTPEEIKKHFGMGADRIFARMLGDERKALQAFELYLEHERMNAHQVRLHDGVEWLLDRIAEERVPIGIVTGRHSEDLGILLSRHGIADRFVTIICDNHVVNSKPAPEGILLAASRMSVDPRALIYVGDSVGDIHAAHAAGVGSVAALWDGLVSREQLAPHGPGYWAEHPREVWEIFRAGR